MSRALRRRTSATSATVIASSAISVTASAAPNVWRSGLHELVGDDVPNHGVVWAAQELGRREVTERREEYQQASTDDTRRVAGSVTWKKVARGDP